MSDFVDEFTLGGEASGPKSLSSLEREGSTASRVITARGTEEGLVLRIDGRTEWLQILEELQTFLGERRRFLDGGEVAIEWLDRLPTKEQSQELENLLRDGFNIEIIGRKRKHLQLTGKRQGGSGNITLEKRQKDATMVPLFDDSALSGERHAAGEIRAAEREFTLSGPPGAEGNEGLEQEQLRRMTELLGVESFYEEDANARVVFGTLRSGQRVETPFTLVVVGDVNPGADLVAGGDIVVVGSLRGTAHASAYDDEGYDRVIFSLQMQPMQLRIGSVISRGTGEAGRGPEIARIEDRRIIVESFNHRLLAKRKVR